ncbi:hypothetical protein L6164_032126 [Bauhinia variegata]|uniref:Uncharacterized protein n=1 Tax=Bauhinia variegata TaxID=167791 RepID=A0ACB9KMJ4_BAUVA|nr:hypothetical protein L6164_032126 [Bauhinia variegata]
MTSNNQQQQNMISIFGRSKIIVLSLFVVLLLTLFHLATSQSTITSLPGFPGKLPFKLETGYVGVGDADSVRLFYYFVESEREPNYDPLVLWLTGGPGCSGLSALFYEIGPLKFDVEDFDGIFPNLGLNEYSWTKVASILFVDAPVGTGFSYAKTSEGYNVSDTISAAQTYEFLRKWLIDHQKFLSNPLYIGGDGYAGITVPIIAQEVLTGNKNGNFPRVSLQGYLLGNPLTDTYTDPNSRVEYAYRVNLLPVELYLAAKTSCNASYVNVDPENVECLDNLGAIEDCLSKLNFAQILEPSCYPLLSPKQNVIKWDRRFPEEDAIETLMSNGSRPHYPELWCRVQNYIPSYIWANDKGVQDALRVQNGTVEEWVRCNNSLSYTYNVNSSVAYHQNLTKSTYRALIYSGDQDLLVPYVGTLQWIRSLNLSVANVWQPWFLDGQVAGYTVEYAERLYELTYATVKGAGTTAPEYKPKPSLAMVDRWFAHYFL